MPTLQVPLFNKHEIDLFKLFKVVLKSGGSDAVSSQAGRHGLAWHAMGRQAT